MKKLNPGSHLYRMPDQRGDGRSNDAILAPAPAILRWRVEETAGRLGTAAPTSRAIRVSEAGRPMVRDVG
jgi:hypothetical protein